MVTTSLGALSFFSSLDKLISNHGMAATFLGGGGDHNIGSGGMFRWRSVHPRYILWNPMEDGVFDAILYE